MLNLLKADPWNMKIPLKSRKKLPMASLNTSLTLATSISFHQFKETSIKTLTYSKYIRVNMPCCFQEFLWSHFPVKKYSNTTYKLPCHQYITPHQLIKPTSFNFSLSPIPYFHTIPVCVRRICVRACTLIFI